MAKFMLIKIGLMAEITDAGALRDDRATGDGGLEPGARRIGPHHAPAGGAMARNDTGRTAR